MVTSLPHFQDKIRAFNQHHRVLVTAVFFLAGFLFDLLTLRRIDDLVNLIQQAAYLIFLGTLLMIEVRIRIGAVKLSDRGQRFWRYHDLIVHFLFGSLLSLYTIFYYTSASAITSLAFILLLVALMAANEFTWFRRMGVPVRVVLYSICVISFFSFFYPILLGHIGPGPFWLGLLSSLVVFGILWTINFRGGEEQRFLKINVVRPALAIHLFFLLAYYTSLIPPVPVAVKKIGVYYGMKKENGSYIGTYYRSWWKFWQKGSQDFQARPGDKIHVLVSIFSPAKFEEQVQLKWYHDDPKWGWKLQDSVPLSIFGGREEGFRGFGIKSTYLPGDWRVKVETSDGREVGRINFSVTVDQNSGPRELVDDVF